MGFNVSISFKPDSDHNVSFGTVIAEIGATFSLFPAASLDLPDIETHEEKDAKALSGVDRAFLEAAKRVNTSYESKVAALETGVSKEGLNKTLELMGGDPICDEPVEVQVAG